MAEGTPGEGISQIKQKSYLIYTTKNILVNEK